MESEHLLVNVDNGVMQLTLNRPESLNAFSPDMTGGIIEALDEAQKNPDIRVVTIKGAGRAFSAGGDVKGMGNNSPINTYERFSRTNRMVLAIRQLEKPVIAIVHGYAAGVAFSIALACDLIVAAEDTKFIMSFAKVGLSVDGGGSYFLPRLVGAQRAKELLFTAEPLDAKKAYEWGIVNRVYPLEELDEKASDFVSAFAKGPGKSYGMMKKLVNQSFVSDLDEMLELERFTQVIMKETSDHHEGVNAFKEKREPQFTGK